MSKSNSRKRRRFSRANLSGVAAAECEAARLNLPRPTDDRPVYSAPGLAVSRPRASEGGFLMPFGLFAGRRLDEIDAEYLVRILAADTLMTRECRNKIEDYMLKR